MKRGYAVLLLSWRFAKAVAVAAFSVSWLIIGSPAAPRRGFALLPYGDLSDTGVVVLAALVTLTPGSSTVDIDTERRELLLHVLDGADLDATLTGLRRKFLVPVRVVFGGRP